MSPHSLQPRQVRLHHHEWIYIDTTANSLLNQGPRSNAASSLSSLPSYKSSPGRFSNSRRRCTNMLHLPLPLHPWRHLSHDYLASQQKAWSQIPNIRHDVWLLHVTNHHHDHANCLGESSPEYQRRNRGPNLGVWGYRTTLRYQHHLRSAYRACMSS